MWLAVHRSDHSSVTTLQGVLSPQEVVACESAVALLAHMEHRQAQQEAAYTQALDQAKKEGFEAGRQEALQQVGHVLLDEWHRVATQASQDAQHLRDAVVTLSVQMVQRIASQLAPEDVITAMARRVLDDMSDQSSLVLHVHPDLADAIRQLLTGQGRLFEPLDLDVRGDPACGLLDMVLETPTGQLLAGLQSQLSTLAQSLQRKQA